MTPQDILTAARDILNDTDSAGYRQSNDELLRWLNEGLALAHPIRPDLFYVVSAFACAADKTLQEISFAGAQAVVDVLRVTGGAAVPLCDKATLDAFRPGWHTDDPGPAANWMRHLADPRRFYIHPPAPANQSLDVVLLPPAPAYSSAQLAADMALPGWIKAALVSYVVARAETKDDEHVNSNRVAVMNEQFAQQIKAGA